MRGPTISDATPMLRMVSGPTPGRLFPLDRGTTVIGRLPDCHIVLAPRYISKRHATIERTPEGYVLTDHSHAGTFIDGVRIDRPIVLTDGLTFSVCDFTFEFHTKLVTVRDPVDSDDATIFLSLDASGQPVTAPGAAPAKGDSAPASARPEEKLRAVLGVSRDLGRTLDLNEIVERALAALFTVFPAARRGFVLMSSAPGEPLVPRAIRSRTGGGPEAGLAISRTVLDRVLNARQAILSRDAALDFPTSESVSDQRLRSLICAPLLDAAQRPIGIVQLDIPDGSGKFGQDDLDLLVAVASQVSIAVEHARMHEQLLSQRELDRELAFSRQVLQALLPEPRDELGGYPFWAFYEPARFVGGDYYGHFPLPRPDDTAAGGPPRRWALAVGDVAGKGMPAALLMSKLSAEVRVVLGDEPEPAAAMGRLNRLLCETGVPEMFVTFLLAVIDMVEHRLTVVNAGHPSPLVRRAGGHLEVPAARALSLPLGVEPGEPFRSLSTTLGSGDLVVLYTDGVIESLDAKGRTLGVERLKQIVHAASPRPDAAGEAVVQAVRRHAGARAQSDDLTLLCIGRPPS
jgi:serine phosphatase RsbU (regulator of sigma subunit)